MITIGSLHPLFQQLATASTEQELRSRLIDNVSEHFRVQGWGIYFLDEEYRLKSCDAKGVPDAFLDKYEKIGRAIDPVQRYVLQYHAPAHEELVLLGGSGKQTEVYQRVIADYNLEHIMIGPIVGNGKLIGTINIGRIGDTRPFNSQDLINLGAVCMHVSACVARLRSQPVLTQNQRIMRLTSRELEIANLVAKGLTNAEIGRQLWITENTVKQALKRMFRKLQVSARTEMVAKLTEAIL